MSECIFCKIIKNEISSRKIYEDEHIIAFLDLTQVTPGHTLVLPKKHVADIFEYDEELASIVFSRIPKIARAIKESDSTIEGMNIVNNNGTVAYQSVFHSHIHLIPRYTKQDNFSIVFGDNSNRHTAKELDHIVTLIKEKMEV
ncbi:histidine triad (HIT) family protein [Carnobacterium iners]|uniref:Histidine triad (HIT) family protein n=1 Tax=Carnobacterium iners TaxID=1073423 RepID=A0A1X7NRM1_9LACT|nr:HIT family protein [Carnobacterium iners]SEK27061.1 histidine triad (HIT) family protein [Carnobacterium iners]SMH40163.1 histidine triad (HIT) family protein [Carnobacterium iners]